MGSDEKVWYKELDEVLLRDVKVEEGKENGEGEGKSSKTKGGGGEEEKAMRKRKQYRGEEIGRRREESQ